MSWFGSRSNSSHQEESSSHASKQKHKQIESLREYIPGYVLKCLFGKGRGSKVFCFVPPSVVEVKRDEQYSTTTTVNGLTLIIHM